MVMGGVGLESHQLPPSARACQLGLIIDVPNRTLFVGLHCQGGGEGEPYTDRGKVGARAMAMFKLRVRPPILMSRDIPLHSRQSVRVMVTFRLDTRHPPHSERSRLALPNLTLTLT